MKKIAFLITVVATTTILVGCSAKVDNVPETNDSIKTSEAASPAPSESVEAITIPEQWNEYNLPSHSFTASIEDEDSGVMSLYSTNPDIDFARNWSASLVDQGWVVIVNTEVDEDLEITLVKDNLQATVSVTSSGSPDENGTAVIVSEQL